MSKWEYLEIVARWRSAEGAFSIAKVNGQRQEQWWGNYNKGRDYRGPTLRQYLNDLGRDGWELATSTPLGPGEDAFWHVLMLKRSLPDA